tara:strand:- start:2823 stop:3074 length:252 start_codon:yes stop_codon:yes gene_type:complete
MCIGRIFSGIFGGSPKRVYIPPPPAPNPAIAEKAAESRRQGLDEQEKASRARKQQLQAGLGRRSLLSSTSGGYLTNTTRNTRL